MPGVEQKENDARIAALQQGLVQQLMNAGITQARVLDAFRKVPRHAFVREWYERSSAPSMHERGVWQRFSREEMGAENFLTGLYQDQPLVTRIDSQDTPSSSSSQPTIMAEMLEALLPQPGNSVLEIGTGTGYNAALLAELVGDPALVTSIDIDQSLVEEAKSALSIQSSAGMTIISGDGLQGYPPNAPYHRIIATGSVASVPYAWVEQLAQNGQMLLNLQRPLLNVILLLKKYGKNLRGEVTSCRGKFMKLHDGRVIAHVSRPGGLINPIIEKVTETSFHPANLFNQDFAFFVQMHLPHAMAYRMTHGSERLTYLYDPESERVIRFDSKHVRGSVELWQELRSIALAFQNLGQPARNAYMFEITEEGQQIFQLGAQTFRMW